MRCQRQYASFEKVYVQTSERRSSDLIAVRIPQTTTDITSVQCSAVVVREGERRLTAVEFQQLAAVPAAEEWFADIDNLRTRRAYQNDLTNFSSFIGLASVDDFRQVTRSRVLARRIDLEGRGLAGATIRRKFAALASLFDYLLDSNAVAGGNPVHSVRRPRIETNEGNTRPWAPTRPKRCSRRRMTCHRKACAFGHS